MAEWTKWISSLPEGRGTLIFKAESRGTTAILWLLARRKKEYEGNILILRRRIFLMCTDTFLDWYVPVQIAAFPTFTAYWEQRQFDRITEYATIKQLFWKLTLLQPVGPEINLIMEHHGKGWIFFYVVLSRNVQAVLLLKVWYEIS